MTGKKTDTAAGRYPGYDVLERMDEWDSHTREIVRERLGPFPNRRILTEREWAYLSIIAGHLVYDNRADIIEWIVSHCDRKLADETGEGERKKGVPPEKFLIREGLKAMDHAAQLSYGSEFGALDINQQFQMLADLQMGKAAHIPQWSMVPQKALFNKLVSEMVSAYYSHPTIWSEIGYGGPMYPQIYVRIEEGLTEPWEAGANGK